MADRIDPSPYNTQIMGDAPFLLALGLKLHLARPHKLSEEAHEAADHLDQSTHALQKEWNLSKKAGSTDLKLADSRVDTAWGATYHRLEAYTWLPPEKFPRVPEAIALFKELFAQGKTFLGFKYAEEWAESERLLGLLSANPAKSKALTDFIGEGFLENVKEAHAAYGEAQGLTKNKPAETKLHLLDRVKESRLALIDYALALVIMANRKSADRADIAPSLQLFDVARTEAAASLRSAPAAEATPAPEVKPAEVVAPAPAPK
jgi:hypothetical protein